MVLVAVSQRVDGVAGRIEIRDGLDQRMASFLMSVGACPVPIPNGMGDEGTRHWLQAVAPKAVVLSGGNDLGDRPERDHTEGLMLDYAERKRVPVLGICRGMQVLGTRAGAHLREVSGHVGRRHDVFGIIQGEKNSFHRFAIHHCPKGYEILAASPDGVIEAVKHVDLPWEGWMWHPEREPVFSEDDGKRLRDLLARVHETT